jgi:hypothetical protein
MSVVLVIIGLIVGGILLGRDLINSAAVNAQISQIQKYQSAVNAFRDKYDYLPGDMPDPYATQVGFTPRGTNPGQGDGNGVIEGLGYPGASGLCVGVGEALAFWNDLGVAQLVDGGFTWGGEANWVGGYNPHGDPQGADIDHLLPPAKIGSHNYVSVWSGGWLEGRFGNGTHSDGNNYFSVSAYYDIGGCWPIAAVTLTPAVAYNIDKKVDDGLPQSGSVMAMFVSDTGQVWAAGNPTGWCAGLPCGPIAPGDDDHNTGGPVVPGDGVSTSPSVTTCYDNGGVSGATEKYSLSSISVSNQNCALSFRFK